jgi:general secretion pathway protein C
LVETPQQRRFSVGIILATLVLCAFFLAQGTTRVVAGELLASSGDVPKPRPRRMLASDTSFNRKRDAAIILRRNIFDSERGDLTQEPLPEEMLGADGEPLTEWDPSKPPPTCTNNLRLVGSVMNPGYPEWSFAAIAGASDGKTLLYRQGGEVDGSKIIAVYPSSVVVASSSGACQLQMFEEDTSSPKVATAKPTPAPPRPGSTNPRNAGLTDEELNDGIEKITDTKYRVQRSLVDKVLANQGSLMRTARVIPHEEDGRVVGMRLYGIRRNSLLGRLGVRNGDMLRTINGFDMTSPDSALEAYTRLRTADQLTLAVKRQNKDMTIEYNIE